MSSRHALSAGHLVLARLGVPPVHLPLLSRCPAATSPFVLHLLKIAYQVLKSGTPYTDLGADFYIRRESPEHKQAWLERQLHTLHPGCTITITVGPPEAALAPGA